MGAINKAIMIALLIIVVLFIGGFFALTFADTFDSKPYIKFNNDEVKS